MLKKVKLNQYFASILLMHVYCGFIVAENDDIDQKDLIHQKKEVIKQIDEKIKKLEIIKKHIEDIDLQDDDELLDLIHALQQKRKQHQNNQWHKQQDVYVKESGFYWGTKIVGVTVVTISLMVARLCISPY